jgi:hypothetical protein
MKTGKNELEIRMLNLEKQFANIIESLKIISQETDFSNVSYQSRVITRKELAKLLNCSERFIADNPVFKHEEKRIGNKVFYDLKKIEKLILDNKSNIKEK